MPIISSAYTLDHAQLDGRRWVTESHTDNVGVVHRAEYLADVGTDYEAVMAARAVAIADQLARDEVNIWLSS